MFAMFDDIYRTTSKDERDRVSRYCAATGADWAKVFYTEDGWNSFIAWEQSPTSWKPNPAAMFFNA